MTNLRIGLVGCGKQAPKHISGLLAVDSDIRVVVADVDQNAAKALAGKFNVEVADSVDALFEMKDIDAIDVCTPVPFHYDLCLRAMHAGKHIFCEKPLVTNQLEAQELERVRAEKDVVGMVGYLYRFTPMLSMFKGLLDHQKFESSFGRPVVANFRIGGRGSHQVWKHRKETGGGAINEMLVHMVDLALWYFGAPEKVEVLSCDQLLSAREIDGQTVDVDAEDIVQVRLQTKSGVLINIQADMLTPSFTQFVEVQGSKGTFCGSIQPSYSSYLFIDEEFEGYTKGMNKLEAEPSNLFQIQMGQFVEAIGDRNKSVSSTIEDSINLIRVMDQISKQSYEH